MQTGNRQCKYSISSNGCVNPYRNWEMEARLRRPNREVAKIFDSLNVKAETDGRGLRARHIRMAADPTNLAAGHWERTWCKPEEKDILDGYTKDRSQSFWVIWNRSLREPEVGNSYKVMDQGLSKLYKGLVQIIPKSEIRNNSGNDALRLSCNWLRMT